MIELQNISVRKSGKLLLQNVSLRARPGQITVVLGPNGAGKTTLVRALLGDDPLHGGEVLIAGRPRRDWAPAELARRVGFLPQSQNLQFPFTVREVVLMGRSNRYRFLERPEDLAAAEHALALVDLRDFADRDFTTLSGGEKQRVSLARVLCQLGLGDLAQPKSARAEDAGEKFLILDEPNNNLDIRHQIGVLDLAARLRDTGVGVIAILHDLSQAAAVADHVVLMHNGKIHTAGPPEVLTDEVIEEVFQVRSHGGLPRFPFFSGAR
jgi:iron complex transport system ATP-binding protein